MVKEYIMVFSSVLVILLAHPLFSNATKDSSRLNTLEKRKKIDDVTTLSLDKSKTYQRSPVTSGTPLLAFVNTVKSNDTLRKTQEVCDNYDYLQIGQDIDGEAGGDLSGRSTSLSSDGRIVAIGAPYNEGINGSSSGHVRVFKYKENGSWEQMGDDMDGEAEGDMSGWSTSLSSDGLIVVIGAQSKEINGSLHSGHVRVFKYNENVGASGSWEQLGGNIDGEDSGKPFNPIVNSSGGSTSLSSDGLIVAIGAFLSGHVRVFKYNENVGVSGSWEQLGTDIVGEGEEDWTGLSTSLSSDGRIVAVGSPRAGLTEINGIFYSGHVRVFKYNENVGASGTWEQFGDDINCEKKSGLSGWITSLSNDGLIVAVGSFSGNVCVFKYNENVSASGTWEQLGADIVNPFAGDNRSVDLSSDGLTVAIGASGVSGRARVFKYNENVGASGSWEQFGTDIVGEASGSSTSLSNDGLTLAVGVEGIDGINGARSGHVLVYSYSCSPTDDSATYPLLVNPWLLMLLNFVFFIV